METYQFVRILKNPQEKDFDPVISEAKKSNGLIKSMTSVTIGDTVYVYILVEYQQAMR
ncbi:hypothetical protein [Bacteroides graminisolvens]|uniref:hypothetical protein n=1 Tax=Bacteroides graminisolvens TaxID=477666 RepID=UPI002409F597|nr:hypothetical protein [Bacteroides graminisolvens]